MHTPVARFTDDLCGLVRMQTGHPELLLPTSLPEIDARHTIGEQTDGGGLADKAVAWMLAPVFFCCVVAEKAKPPQTWEATEVFSRVVVAYMLRLFVMVADLTGGGLQQQTVQRLKEGK
ncbi:unnamed protein product [Phytophthora lilii]|uniref:Unnamed protein product n=1 Tax=Phytophthora lilii TaxID=2077276 RepID=A0A9W6TFA6_9STRA|nr:unnamed protein product [Phytophthora lilii]